MQRLSSPAILGFVVRPVLNLSDIRFPGFALLLVVAAVFHYRLNLFLFQVGVVFFAAVACIRNYGLWRFPKDPPCF